MGAAPHAWDVRTASARGASHLRSGAPNQDAVASHRSTDGALAIVAVADGHGSKRSFRSDIGASLAAEIGTASMRTLMERVVAGEADAEREAKTLPVAIMSGWRAKVEQHAALHRWRPAELADAELDEPLSAEQVAIAYGSTLLLVGVAPGFGIVSQLGDGDIIWVWDESASRPLGDPLTQYGSETVSLASGKLALSEWRVGVERWDNAPALIMLSTDGYSNSYAGDEKFLEVVSDLRRRIADHGLARVAESLPGWLRDTSREGAGDDISVGLLVSSPVEPAGGGGLASSPRSRPPLIVGATLVLAGALAGWAAGSAGFGPDLRGGTAPTETQASGEASPVLDQMPPEPPSASGQPTHESPSGTLSPARSEAPTASP